MNPRNLCIFNGNIGKVELKYLSNEKTTALIEASLGVYNPFTKDEKKKSDWVDLKLFGDRAEKFAEKVNVGTSVTVHCHYQKDSWTDDAGQTRSRAVFIIDEWLVHPKNAANGGASSASEKKPAAEAEDTGDYGF